MKPRLRYSGNVWDCRLPDYKETRVIGFGYTPREAFENWKQEKRRSVLRAQIPYSEAMPWRVQ